MRIGFHAVPAILIVGAAVGMAVWSVIEDYPVGTAVVVAIGALVYWRVRRNQDGDPVPPARLARRERDDGERADGAKD